MPTGFDIQKRFDNLVADLSAATVLSGSEMAVDIPFRSVDNTLSILSMHCVDGVVSRDEKEAIQLKVDGLKAAQDAFNTAKFSYDNQNTSENVSAIGNALGEYRPN